MRGKRRQHHEEVLDDLPLAAVDVPQGVEELHQRGDGGVVAERLDRLGDLLPRLVPLDQNGVVDLVAHQRDRLALADEVPDLVEEPSRSAEAGVAEVAALLERAQEHQVHPEGVGAPFVEVLVGDDDIAARLGHLGAVLDDQPVRPEARERLVEREQPLVVQHHGDEARVEQVEHGVLVAADVGGHGAPLPHPGRVERPVIEVGAGVAQVVPGRVEEGVGHVGLAPGLRAAGGAGHEIPRRVACQWRDPAVVGPEVFQIRQQHRELVFGHRHRPARLAVDHRDRWTPVPLARDAPVIEAVLDLPGTLATPGQPVGDGGLGLQRWHPVEGSGIDHPAGLVVLERLSQRGGGLLTLQRHDADDRQPVPGGKGEVPRIVTGHRHDGAGPVLHQHIVGDPDRHRRASGGVGGVAPREHAALLLVPHLARYQVLGGDRLPVGGDHRALRLRGQLIHERMLRGQYQEACPEDRVRPCGEDPDAGGAVHREVDVRALRAAQPVALGAGGGLGPVHLCRIVQVGQEPIGIVRDAEEPLFQCALLHRRLAPFAEAALHLLVGEHRLAGRAPVDRRPLLVGLPCLVQLQEEPLGPLVVPRVGGRELVPPVEHPAEAGELAAEVDDVARDQLGGMGAKLDREILAVNAECVEADRLKDVVSLQPLEAAVDVRAGEREEVPDVQPLGGGVGEHHQVVERPGGAVQVGLVGAPLGPAGLPLGLDRAGLVVVISHGGGI